MARFFCLHELRKPEDMRPFLADPELHWREGYSACELATSWVTADDIPTPVRNVLDTCPEYRGAELVEGYFERKVDLRTKGRPSQTDLMVLAKLKEGLGVIAVEGKVEESFGPLISKWNNTPGKDARLRHLCQTLGVRKKQTGDLRYQLFHRTASAIFEAERYCARQAMMLVHSFSETDTSINDFLDFAGAIKMPVAGKDTASEPRRFGEVELRLAWVSDTPSK